MLSVKTLAVIPAESINQAFCIFQQTPHQILALSSASSPALLCVSIVVLRHLFNHAQARFLRVRPSCSQMLQAEKRRKLWSQNLQFHQVDPRRATSRFSEVMACRSVAQHSKLQNCMRSGMCDGDVTGALSQKWPSCSVCSGTHVGRCMHHHFSSSCRKAGPKLQSRYDLRGCTRLQMTLST